MFYLYEIRESDGNDCTVYDCIIEGESRKLADRKLSEHFASLAKERNWDHDGNFCGYFFPCDCDIPQELPDVTECDECEMVSINGIPCHETECPYERQQRKIESTIENWECSHGGLIVSEDAEEFASEDEAEEACKTYHSRYEV